MALPTAYSSEKNKGYAHIGIGCAASVVALAATTALTPYIAYLDTFGVSQTTLGHAGRYFSSLANGGLFEAWTYVWNQASSSLATWGAILGTLSVLPAAWAALTNPYRLHDLIYGDAKFADRVTVKSVEKEGSYSFSDGIHLHLGYFNGQPLRLVEGRSGAVYAPPGSGKTAAVIVPCIVSSDQTSLIVHDSKPELATMTSGWRQRVGPVYVLDFSATDFIDKADYDNPAKTRFYVTINPLDPQVLPSDPADRDTAIDAMWQLLIPPPKGGGGANDYFNMKGRAAGVGFTHYLHLKVNEYGDYSGLPERWVGKKASFPMLVDYIASAQMDAANKVEREKAEAQMAGEKAPSKDAMSEWLRTVVNECKDWKDSERCYRELSTLVSMAPNERSGVLGTLDSGLIPFKNKAVAERMSDCMLTPAMMRGEKVGGVWRPVTLYVCCNQAEAKAFASVTALIYDMFARYHCTYRPGEKDKRGTLVGPFNVYYVLDEFKQLPQIPAVADIAAVGRSMGCSILISTQSESQYKEVYGAEQTSTQRSLMGFRVFLNQNDPESIKLCQDMVGPTTIEKKSVSKSSGSIKMDDWGKSNTSLSLERIELMRHNDVSAMSHGTQVVLLQGFMSRPFVMKSPFFFSDPVLKPRVFNMRSKTGPAPAPPLPYWRWEQALEKWEADPANILQAAQYRRLRAEKRRIERGEMG